MATGPSVIFRTILRLTRKHLNEELVREVTNRDEVSAVDTYIQLRRFNGMKS